MKLYVCVSVSAVTATGEVFPLASTWEPKWAFVSVEDALDFLEGIPNLAPLNDFAAAVRVDPVLKRLHANEDIDKEVLLAEIDYLAKKIAAKQYAAKQEALAAS